jgi:hypothetical protein
MTAALPPCIAESLWLSDEGQITLFLSKFFWRGSASPKGKETNFGGGFFRKGQAFPQY